MRTDDPNADVRQTCTRKKPYGDERLARKVAAKASQRAGQTIVAYACTRCGQWHIGHGYA